MLCSCVESCLPIISLKLPCTVCVRELHHTVEPVYSGHPGDQHFGNCRQVAAASQFCTRLMQQETILEMYVATLNSDHSRQVPLHCDPIPREGLGMRESVLDSDRGAVELGKGSGMRKSVWNGKESLEIRQQ